MAGSKADEALTVLSDHKEDPKRLSALYQYHNAPEVLPAQGLEYDDGDRAHSYKHPIIHRAASCPAPAYYSTEFGPGSDHQRPPRIIFGMKLKVFLLVAAVMVLVIVGAAVGGAVGGRQLRGQSEHATSTQGNESASNATPLPTGGAAVATMTPTTDCPQSDNESYVSSYAHGSAGTVPSGSGLSFTKHCDLNDPLAQTSATKITEAFVFTFNDCVDVCAGYNFWNSGRNCSVAVYQVGSGRPGNCWIGFAEGVNASSLSTLKGTDVALLNAS